MLHRAMKLTLLGKTLNKYSVSATQDIVLLVHGLMSLRDRVRFPEIAAALAAKGVGSLRFDLTGNGDSAGTFTYAGSFGEVRSLVKSAWYHCVTEAAPHRASAPDLVAGLSPTACARWTCLVHPH